MDQIVSYLRRVPPGPALAIAAVVALAFMSTTSGAAERVPALEGMPVEAARTRAADDGFGIRVTMRPGSGVAGTVTDQEPAAGSVANKGTAIALDVTEGVKQVKVPNVLNMPVDEARRALTKAGLRAGDVTYRREPGKERNRVIETQPKVQTSVDIGTTVHLVAAT